MRRLPLLVLALMGGCAAEACPPGPPSLCAVSPGYYRHSLTPPRGAPSASPAAEKKAPVPAPDVAGQIEWMKNRLDYR